MIQLARLLCSHSGVLTVIPKRQGETKDVAINRMKSEQIADKRRIFELFTKILDTVAGYDERQVARLECVLGDMRKLTGCNAYRAGGRGGRMYKPLDANDAG